MKINCKIQCWYMFQRDHSHFKHSISLLNSNVSEIGLRTFTKSSWVSVLYLISLITDKSRQKNFPWKWFMNSKQLPSIIRAISLFIHSFLLIYFSANFTFIFAFTASRGISTNFIEFMMFRCVAFWTSNRIDNENYYLT